MPKIESVFYKSAEITNNTLTNDELSKINSFTLEPLEEEQIFSFKMAMCGNDIDRDFEVFPIATLEKLQPMFVGKTVMKDHDRRSDNQIARIYDTYVSYLPNTMPNGEPEAHLIAKCYMIKTDKNKELISEIKGGIRREVSLGCRITQVVCSVCGEDNMKTYCSHFGGEVYDNKKCYFALYEPTDAYEVSFVAIPAQPQAGVVKSYDGLKQKEKEETTKSKDLAKNEESSQEKISGHTCTCPHCLQANENNNSQEDDQTETTTTETQPEPEPKSKKEPEQPTVEVLQSGELDDKTKSKNKSEIEAKKELDQKNLLDEAKIRLRILEKETAFKRKLTQMN